MRNLLLLLTIPFLTWGCTTTQPIPKEPAPFKSILIAPIINESPNVSAGEALYYKLPRTINEKGYYVFPMRTVLDTLEQEGLYEPEKIYQLGPQKITDLFGSDAVLFTKITYWDTKYNVISSMTEAHIEVQIFTKDGKKILDKKLIQKYSPNDANGGLIGNLIVSAFERALPNNDMLEFLLTWRIASELQPGPY